MKLSKFFQLEGTQSLKVSNKAFEQDYVNNIFADTCCFYEVTFSNISFSRCQIFNSTFKKCTFVKCRFDDTFMEQCTYENLIMKKCFFLNFSGVKSSNFLECEFLLKNQFENTGILECGFKYCKFSFLYLDQCEILDVELSNVKIIDIVVTKPRITENIIINNLL